MLNIASARDSGQVLAGGKTHAHQTSGFDDYRLKERRIRCVPRSIATHRSPSPAPWRRTLG